MRNELTICSSMLIEHIYQTTRFTIHLTWSMDRIMHVKTRIAHIRGSLSEGIILLLDVMLKRFCSLSHKLVSTNLNNGLYFLLKKIAKLSSFIIILRQLWLQQFSKLYKIWLMHWCCNQSSYIFHAHWHRRNRLRYSCRFCS